MRCISPIYTSKLKMHVPCGKCAFCVKRAIDGWCLRLKHEMAVSSSAFFFTLTYENVPTNHVHEDCVNSHLDGELCKRDLMLFLKRLRFHNPGIRYFAIGEYGTQKARPHYHAVIFNLVDLDLVSANWISPNGVPIGFVSGSRATMGRIRYMVSYMALGQDVKHKQPPFRVMSRNPGIGSTYISQMKEWHRARSDSVVYDFQTPNSMPRFYKDKIFVDKDWVDPETGEVMVNKGPLRYINHQLMLHSLNNPMPDPTPMEHELLFKKLNRKNR